MKTTGVLLATVAGTIVAPVANAADMPIKVQRGATAAPVVAAVPSWAGLYVGVHAGVAMHRAQAHHDGGYYGSSLLNLENTKTGFIGGGQIGYNLQFGNVVVGVEGDVSGLDGKTKAASTFFTNTPFASNSTATSEINWMATARARLGLTTGNLLVFVTGGVAWAEIENNWRENIINYNTGATWSEKKTKTAPVFGVGAEYMFTPNWTGRLEALFADFGDTTINTGHFDSSSYTPGEPTTFKNRVMVVRGALNYKF